MPTWLHEGFAKYVGASRVEGDRLTFDAAPIRTDRASPVPLRRLFASSSADFFGASARRQYLTAWMLVRRLLAGQAPDASHWRNLVARTVVAPTPAAQAAIISEALGGLSPDEMDGAIRPDRSHDPERTMAVVTLARAHRRQPRVAARGSGCGRGAQARRQGTRASLNAATTSGGACTSSISTPSPPSGDLSSPLG